MKNALIFLFTLCCFNQVEAQFSPIFSQAAEELSNASLQIVMTDDERFNSTLQLVVSEEMSTYDYEFVTKEDFEATYSQGDPVFALVLSTGDFDLPMAGGLVVGLQDLPFYGIIREYHQQPGDYKPGYSIMSYTLNIPGKDGMSLESSLRLYIRNLNNEVRGQGENFTASMRERQDWAQEVPLLMLDTQFESSLSALKKSYPHDIELVKAKRIHEAVLQNEEVILCVPYIASAVGGTTDVLYLTYMFVADGSVVEMANTSFLVKKDNDKYKLMQSKAEQKALKEYSKKVK